MLPAAASLKKQGANNGATTAFLISTPESGVDSISITYALLDPIMTVARPVAAFLTACIAGITENLINPPKFQILPPAISCTANSCCTEPYCLAQDHSDQQPLLKKVQSGLRYAFGELWGDLAGWFLLGLLLGGLITVLVPEEFITAYLGGGFTTMLLMLAVGIPLYICASASTPIAAALILKGVSPGAALVFLLVGPATNVTSLSVLLGLLGKRATTLYLATIAVVSILCGLLLDKVYGWIGVSARAMVGQAGEVLPYEIRVAGAVVILLLSVKPLYAILRDWGRKFLKNQPSSKGRGCSSGNCATKPPLSPPKA